MVSFPSLLTLTFCLPLFFIALYIAFKEYQKTDLFRCSEIGEINLSEDDSKTALITQRSFYNGIFIFISLEYKVDFLNRKTNNPTRLILFRDSISEQDYRLIARLINHQ